MTEAIILPTDEEEAANFLEQEGLVFDLNATIRAHAEIIIDLQDMGAMYQYVLATRERARDAMMEIMRTDPTDAVRIAQLQMTYQKWTDVIDHIASVREEADNAEKYIKENFDGEDSPDAPQD